MQSENPKDLTCAGKVPVDLFPPAGIIYGAMGCADGDRKYGHRNWREKDISLRNYIGAIMRHCLCILDGQDIDPQSGKPHLAHIIATGGILADATENGHLIDDRHGVYGPAPELLEAAPEMWQLPETGDFEDESPPLGLPRLGST